MKSLPPRPGPTPRPPRRDSYLIYLPGGLPVLRTAIEDLIGSGWSEAFRRRASEITCAFEGSFRAGGHQDLAVIVRSIASLLDLDYREVADLGPALPEKLQELLGRLEAFLGTEDASQTA
jgi:hypothetical protein